MSIAVITTSINPRPKTYERWSQVGNLYVAGDLNSPEELGDYVRELGGVYLSPEDQDTWSCSDAIGWRNIQRRNAALLAALADGGYEYVITVDDDNDPGDAALFASTVRQRLGSKPSATAAAVKTSGLWFNPGRLAMPPFRQRGLPAGYSDLDNKFVTYWEDAVKTPRPGVLQCAILGDPDTDAVQRIVRPVHVTSYDMDVYPEVGVFAPFNSQATAWPIRYAPLMAVIPRCERYDDIFASIIATRILHHFNEVVLFGKPYVYQDRNPHDYGADLQAEVRGMRIIDAMVKLLADTKLPESDDIFEHYDILTRALIEHGYLTMGAYAFVSPFMADVRTTGWKP